DDGGGDGRLLGGLRIRLCPADADQCRAHRREQPAGLVTLGRNWPGCCVHGPVVRPRPHLFGRERQEGGQQAQHHIDGSAEREGGGCLCLRFRRTIGAFLHEFQVVVAERPEELFGRLQRPRVVVVLERLGGGLD